MVQKLERPLRIDPTVAPDADPVGIGQGVLFGAVNVRDDRADNPADGLAGGDVLVREHALAANGTRGDYNALHGSIALVPA